MKIPLPSMTSKPEAKAHIYPFQIGFQTEEFLQATLLYTIFADTAAGELVRQPGGFAHIEKIILDKLPQKNGYDDAWKFLEKHLPIFEKANFQSVLIALNSQWDWYVRKLGEFIIFACTENSLINNAGENKKRLERIDKLPIIEQIKVLEIYAGVSFALSSEDQIEINEMSLVRNLGLHNRWEVDGKYLTLSKHQNYEVGDIRIIDKNELQTWHSILIQLLNKTTTAIAIAFVNAPQFPVNRSV